MASSEPPVAVEFFADFCVAKIHVFAKNVRKRRVEAFLEKVITVCRFDLHSNSAATGGVPKQQGKTAERLYRRCAVFCRFPGRAERRF